MDKFYYAGDIEFEGNEVIYPKRKEILDVSGFMAVKEYVKIILERGR